MSAQPGVSIEQRRWILQQEVARSVTRGSRVEYATPDVVVLTSGHQMTHLLHFILFMVTCGLWAVVWIWLAATNDYRREALSVDEFGRVLRVPAGS